MLGRKQTSRQQDWIAAYQSIETLVPRAVFDRLFEQTVEQVKAIAHGRQVAFAWSGGKDSLALQGVCEAAGIDACVMGLTDLEYPAFLQWVTDHMPWELEIVHTGQTLTWLAAHPDMLFPQDAKTAATWFRLVQQTAQAIYYARHRLDMLILGRRRADGNYTGRDGSGLYTNREGLTRYCPLRDWSHEHVLAYMRYYGPAWPPIYGWPNGFQVGTGPWAARQWTGSVENGWREVWCIDSSIVEEAAPYLASARLFLDKVRAGCVDCSDIAAQGPTSKLWPSLPRPLRHVVPMPGAWPGSATTA